MNPYNTFKHITNEEALHEWLAEKEHEAFLKSLEPTAVESFQTNINRIFKDALNQLNTIEL
jgi:hypothetical protein